MPPSLKIEVYSTKNDQWVPVNQINVGDPDGSLSDNHSDGRDVYLFGVDPINNQGYVLKSRDGYDTAGSNLREIFSIGFIAIATLDHRESHELTVRTDTSPEPRRVRFTYFED